MFFRAFVITYVIGGCLMHSVGDKYLLVDIDENQEIQGNGMTKLTNSTYELTFLGQYLKYVNNIHFI